MNKNNRNKIVGMSPCGIILYALGTAALVVSAAESQEAVPSLAREML